MICLTSSSLPARITPVIECSEAVICTFGEARGMSFAQLRIVSMLTLRKSDVLQVTVDLRPERRVSDDGLLARQVGAPCPCTPAKA